MDIQEGKKYKALVVSVGGTPEPIIFSIKYHRPEYIIFFSSYESSRSVTEILQKIDYAPNHYKIETEDANNLLKCYETLKRELPKYIERLKLNKEDILVDYTGGTKTMSSAIVLASRNLGYEFCYIAGKERDKGGLGVVKTGTEEPVIVYNPYNFYGEELNKDFEILFNTYRFTRALEVLDEILGMVKDDSLIQMYKILQRITNGYLDWDNFNHKSAKNHLDRGYRELDVFCAGSRNNRYMDLRSGLKKNLEFLENLINKKGEFLVYDLIANADRRAYVEGRYDDAMARLYRALEKTAQNELSSIGINSSKVQKEQIPEDLREEYVRRYYDEEIKTLKISLYASYRLLEHLGNELGKIFMENYEKSIKGILDARNNSILAHGDQPITKEKYEQMRDILINFIGGEEKLPKFPQIKIE